MMGVFCFLLCVDDEFVLVFFNIHCIVMRAYCVDVTVKYWNHSATTSAAVAAVFVVVSIGMCVCVCVRYCVVSPRPNAHQLCLCKMVTIIADPVNGELAPNGNSCRCASHCCGRSTERKKGSL